MSTADEVHAAAAALLAKVTPASTEPPSVLKPAPEQVPSMSAVRAREIMRAELPPQTYEPWPPVDDVQPAPEPLPPALPPTRWQRIAAWMNRPLVK